MAPILSSLTVIIAGAINGKFHIVNGIYPQLVAWITGAVLSVAAWFLNLVPVGEPTWLAVVVLCFVVGLSSNGIYDIPTIHDFIDRMFPNRRKK
jgi:hypothetical protein